LGAGGLRVIASSLFLAVALLRLVIVPCSDARKTGAPTPVRRGSRGPLYFYHGLLTLLDGTNPARVGCSTPECREAPDPRIPVATVLGEFEHLWEGLEGTLGEA
jgi:hypothetical protein